MSVSIRIVAIACGAAALAFVLGCGQPPEQKGTETSQEEPSAAAKTPRSPAPAGEVVNPNVVRSKELPANFPDDVPQHPDANVIESRATSDLGLSVYLVVPDDASEVASFYADSLASEGWSTDIRRMPDGTAVFADKGNRTAAVMVAEGRRGAEVRLLLGHR